MSTTDLTDDQRHAIERIIDFVVRETVCPPGHKLTLEVARTGTLLLLQWRRLPTPSWLDDAITYAAAFNERDLDSEPQP
jgi:hypothetical protein